MSPTRSVFNRALAPILCCLALTLTACGDDAPNAGAKKAPPKGHLVEVVPLHSKPLSFEVVRTGTLEARKSVRIFNQEEGRIDLVNVREGDRVRAGDVLIELDRRLLAAELEIAIANRRKAESDLTRAKELSKRNVTTQERLDNAETGVSIAKAEERLIRTRLEYGRILAPFDGIITERLIEPGDVAPTHSHLLSLSDPNSLYTKVAVSELMIPRLEIGAPLSVSIDALGSTPWAAKIERIHPTIDAHTRQGIVEISLTPVPERAREGQLCRVTLRAKETLRPVIPFSALRRNNDSEYVFVLEGDVAKIRTVQTGLRYGSDVEILSGLTEGEQVVIRGFLDLRDGKKVTIVTPEASN